MNAMALTLLAAFLALAAPAWGVVDDNYTKSLLHLDGVDGSTTFTDEARGKVWTPLGTARIKTEQSKFGGASAFFDGSGSYIETPNSLDFEPGAEPFTIDFWIYPLDTGSTSPYLAGKSLPDFGQGYDIRLYNQTIHVVGVNGWDTNIRSDASATINAWHHIAVSSTADTVYLFIDGVQKGTCPRSTIASQNIPFRIGLTTNYGGTAFNGYLDEFRFSKGIARWTANFTPPAAPYAPARPTVNLAPLHGVASANATYNGYFPSLTIDDNWETQWAAPAHGTAENPFWLQVDLQKSYKVDQIVLVFAHSGTYSGYTNVYNLYTSPDGITWNLVRSGTLVDSLDPAVYVTTIPLAANQIIRYARYDVVGGSHWGLMFEMEIWGDPIPFPRPIAPTLFLLLD
jgi:hypothetical protein